MEKLDGFGTRKELEGKSERFAATRCNLRHIVSRLTGSRQISVTVINRNGYQRFSKNQASTSINAATNALDTVLGDDSSPSMPLMPARGKCNLFLDPASPRYR
ncbi:hypothetical protein E4U60_002853 [Claviceps pazoutovae]|uniref:Uncharacterized protein n=1 Tax=Claviceps pazoutovae TaxID=1649127 RepID=A0A9P7SFK5_9HYPO|nr:hypothetical protein E4U60_002853 [Claviceps pazoutovae]